MTQRKGESTRKAIRIEVPGSEPVVGEKRKKPSSISERCRAETQILGGPAAEGRQELEFDLLELPPKYRLERPLGEGGFGVVWLATDTDLERFVAIKFLTEAGQADVVRFRREARFAARLDHPAVVEVYELAEHAGRWFIAMEFLEGGNLEEAQLGPRELALALREVAVAMGVAHQHGIVHRDIKPENILLDGAGRAHLTDFGIAADVRREALEEEGTVVGTPDLMAPEQARGETARVDARTDVYALGATLYTLLTHHRPFARSSLLTTLTAVLRDEPRPPREIAPQIPEALAAISLRCLQKAPSARYPSMSAVVAALDAYLDGTGPGASGEGPALSEFDPVGLALEASHLLADWDRVQGRRSRPLDLRPLQGLQARLTATLRERPDLAWVRFLRGRCALRLGRYLSAVDDLERSVDRLSGQAWAQRELGELYLRLALFEQEQPARGLSFVSKADHLDVTRGYLVQAVLAFEEALRLAPDSVDWQLEFAFALDAYSAGQPALAQRRLDELLERDPDLPWAWRLRGRAASAQGQDPRQSYRQALEVRRGDVQALLALGEEEAIWGEFAAAEAALERALRAAPADPGVLLARAQVHLRRELELEGEGPGAEGLVRARDSLEHAWSADPLPHERRQELLGTGREVPRAAIEAGWVELALEALEGLGPRPDASELAPAKAHLLQAQHLLRHGGDPRPDLDALLRACQSGLNVASGQAWQELLGEAWGAR